MSHSKFLFTGVLLMLVATRSSFANGHFLEQLAHRALQLYKGSSGLSTLLNSDSGMYEKQLASALALIEGSSRACNFVLNGEPIPGEKDKFGEPARRPPYDMECSRRMEVSCKKFAQVAKSYEENRVVFHQTYEVPGSESSTISGLAQLALVFAPLRLGPGLAVLGGKMLVTAAANKALANYGNGKVSFRTKAGSIPAAEIERWQLPPNTRSLAAQVSRESFKALYPKDFEQLIKTGQRWRMRRWPFARLSGLPKARLEPAPTSETEVPISPMSFTQSFTGLSFPHKR